MLTKKMTLDEFRMGELRHFPTATGQLSNLLREIGLAGKRIHAEISRTDRILVEEELSSINPSGEKIVKLDQFANDELLNILKKSISCAGIVSEEENDIHVFDNNQNNKSKYVVMFDPVDGSGNACNCITLGSIFGIYRRLSPFGTPCELQDFLQPGRSLMAAGYIIYGSSTMMVYATVRGVNGFTLDSGIGEFCLTHPGIRCPEQGNIYSLNESNLLQYPASVIRFIKSMQRWNERNPGSFTSRYVGSMVADLHRTLLKGGIFLYPSTRDYPEGKLRLMYECNPVAFIAEAAGGLASNGTGDLLDIVPQRIHQRSPLYIGSRKMVQHLVRNFRNGN